MLRASGQQTSASSGIRRYFWPGAALLLSAVKLWLVQAQTIYAIGPAIHDDKLFIQLAEHIINGQWLGPYNQFTLAKGPLYSLFVAGNFWLGLPLLVTQQILYLGACAVLVVALRPWLRTAALQFTFYGILALNPMSYDASNLTRLMRQSIYTPLGMLVIAGLIILFTRRRDAWSRLVLPASTTGLALGGFWLTREESVWLLPAIGLLTVGIALSIWRERRTHWRAWTVACGCFLAAYALPVLAVSWQNYRHYGWFGTVEFRAAEFKDAYGALSRIAIGPSLPQVPVTRQMREVAYTISSTFAKLQPYLEGDVGTHWAEREMYPPEERQIRGGWFMWAMRDAMAAAGMAPDARVAMQNYQRIADEVNAACDSGRVASTAARSGFFPKITRADIAPIWQETLDYLVYFGAFKGFTAQSPDSVGDYAELKPFRDYTSTALSYAPRSPMPPPPNQGVLQRVKLDFMQQAGVLTGAFLAWVGPILLLLALARGVESLFRRRCTYLLWLAVSLLASVAAYLAINILITVTSFKNVSPGAMAAAYPLYLIALFAIALDVVQSWGRVVAPAPKQLTAPLPSRWRWLVPAGATLIVFAARLREIHLFGGDLPYNDQWIIEAQQIIAPWLDGTLRPWTFFLPHFEHVPMWTRLLAWFEVVGTGRWDPLVEMTVNSAFYGAFVWCAGRWIWRNFSSLSAGVATVVLMLGGALPHAWENISWGFQSQFPLALLFLWWHLHDSLSHPVGSRPWWIAQAAGFAGFFTLASMWLAPLALVATHFWTRQTERRGWTVPAILTGVGVLMLIIVHWHFGTERSFAQTASGALDFAHSALHLLSWPNGLPGAAAILVLPWLIHALRLRQTVNPSTSDRLIFALGLWALLQAAGLAFARTGDTSDYVSRYGDILFMGTLAGVLALIRLSPRDNRNRTVYLVGAIVWISLVAGGLYQRATEGHARYFHQHAADNAHIRRIAIQSYLKNGDTSLLEQGTTRWVLFQNTEVITDLLDRSDFRALLPQSVTPDNHDTTSLVAVRWLLKNWNWWFIGGLVLLGGGLVVVRYRGGATAPAELAPPPDKWIFRIGILTGATCFAGVLFWSQPVFTDRDARWQQLLGGDAALTSMTFNFSAPGEFPQSRIQGAAPVNPVELRNRLYGTAPAGPALTCTIFSSAFTVTKDWLVIPYAGYPVGVGNGLRVQLLAAGDGHVEREIECLPPNLDGLGFCAVDLKAVRGRQVRLVLYDGRVDTEAWLAIAPPIPTDSPELAVNLAQRVRIEQHSSLPVAFTVMGLVALFGAFAARIMEKRAKE